MKTFILSTFSSFFVLFLCIVLSIFCVVESAQHGNFQQEAIEHELCVVVCMYFELIVFLNLFCEHACDDRKHQPSPLALSLSLCAV